MNKPKPIQHGLLFLMKVTMFSILISSFSLAMATAHSSAGQETLERKVTIDVKNSEFQDVLLFLAKQARVKFVYSPQIVKKEKKVTLALNEVSLADALSALLGNSYRYRVIGKQIVLVPHPPASSAEEDAAKKLAYAFKVTGVVTDGAGALLPGVNVMIKGTTVGTTTDSKGAYTIDAVSGDATLVFSFIGFATKEVAVNNQSTVDVILSEDTQSLNEVVVTALGLTRDKAALPYAVTEVPGENLTKARENNLGSALSGRIAGVNATSTATGPGGSSRVIIRGNGSLGGNNQPLYVVNGIPINNTTYSTVSTYGGTDKGDGLNSINPDDIASISVLKGGTAAALYGSRAANGVIIITTKSGKAQEGIGVDFSSTYTMESPLKATDWQYAYGSGSRGLKPASQADAIANGRMSWGAPMDGTPVIQPDGVSRPYSPQRNNIKNFYDVGSTFSNTLALSGGTEAASFRFSAANMDNKGIIPNSTLNRKTFNLSVNSTLAKKVVLQANVQYSIELNKNRTSISDFTSNPNASVGVMATSLDVRTLAPGYDADGYETPWNDYVFVTNPYFAVNKVKNQDERHRLISSFSTRYNITDWLYVRGRLGIDYYNIDGYSINPTGLLWNPKGDYETTENQASETNAEVLVGFDKAFGKFSVTALAGGNKMHNEVSSGGLESGQLIVPFKYFIGNGSNQVFKTPVFRESAINSIFASVDIGFNHYLYLSLTGRKDWFSTLSMANNSKFYPSAGLSFVFSDAWTTKPAWLSLGKVRASLAQVGGGAPDPYGLGLSYTAQSVNHLGQPLMAITGTTIPNNELKPYTSTTAEAGIETRLFNNRVGVDLTFYRRTTTNDIVNASVATSSSYESVLLNVGEMRNQGIELLLTGTPVTLSSGLTWDVSFNMAYNTNKVIKIADGLTSLAIPGAIPRTENAYIYHYEGQSFGMIAGNKMMRDANGNIVYNNANGIPLQSEITPLGRGVPPLTMGLNNSVSYKNFNLSFLIDGKFGSKIYSSANAYGAYFGLSKITADNRVRENGVAVQGVDQNGAEYDAVVPAQEYYQGIAYSITDQFVYDASFIKLRQLTFGYSVPRTLLAKTPFQALSLSFVARNLLLLYSEVPNIDPESNYSNGNGQGLENFGIPTTRSYGFNLSVRF
jgi:TonB-linked SusC/RagA family outer membrane protein